MAELLGWASSIILLLTICSQVLKQWRDNTSRGVSKWLFAGQLAASLGFCLYSYLISNHVFIVTNLLLAGSAVVGLAITLHHRRRAAGR